MERGGNHDDDAAPEQRSARPSIAEPNFDQLYEKWHPVVWAAARPLLPCDDDADDAVERVFLRILRRPNRAPKAGWNAAYFIRAGRNEALQLLRATQRDVPISEALVVSVPSRAVQPDRLLNIGEVRARLRRLADALPARCSAVVKLRLDGASNPEIAQKLGISVNAIEKQVSRGRRLLDEDLARRGHDGLSLFLDPGGGEES